MLKTAQMVPEIGLAKENRHALVSLLNTVLADEHLIYTKTRHAHWNIDGPQFFALHELLENQYDQLKIEADELAERVRMLGGNAIGTMTEFLEHTRLEENPGSYPQWREMINNLRKDHEKIAAMLRNDIELAIEDHRDEGTGDLFVELLRMHEEMAWMLRATITG